jgi:hypothetical protein
MTTKQQSPMRLHSYGCGTRYSQESSHSLSTTRLEYWNSVSCSSPFIQQHEYPAGMCCLVAETMLCESVDKSRRFPTQSEKTKSSNGHSSSHSCAFTLCRGRGSMRPGGLGERMPSVSLSPVRSHKRADNSMDVRLNSDPIGSSHRLSAEKKPRIHDGSL